MTVLSTFPERKGRRLDFGGGDGGAHRQVVAIAMFHHLDYPNSDGRVTTLMNGSWCLFFVLGLKMLLIFMLKHASTFVLLFFLILQRLFFQTLGVGNFFSLFSSRCIVALKCVYGCVE